MQRRALFHAGIHGVQIGGILEEVAVGNGLGDAGQVLKHHPARADVGVANLTVAHLARGQAHVQPGGGELRVGKLLKETVQPGGLRRLDGISGQMAVGHAEAVHND